MIFAPYEVETSLSFIIASLILSAPENKPPTMHLRIDQTPQGVSADPALVRTTASSIEAPLLTFDEPSNSENSSDDDFAELSSSDHAGSSSSSSSRPTRSSRYSRTSRRRHRSDRPYQHTTTTILPGQTPPASTSAIMKLSHIRVFPDDKAAHQSDDRCCSVCSERLVDGVVLTRLPCGHIYHIGCIVPWLNRACTCPDCRYELPTVDKKFEAGREERMKGRKLAASCGCPSHGYHTCIFPIENTQIDS